jgi:glycosyltransferase involved in cell wall biosynthesis
MTDRAAPELGRVALLCGTGAGESNAILEYTHRLDSALRDLGVASAVETVDEHFPDLGTYDTVVLQYNPFLYGRWGFAPQLPAALLRERRGRRFRLALMVHETYFPISDPRSALMGSWQRVQLRALHAISDLVFASIESWAELLAQWRPRRPVAHLPVGSNLPDRRSERAAAREQIGAGDETMVIALFGSGHSSRLIDYIVAATNSVARERDEVVLLNLGAGANAPARVDGGVRVIQPGWLAPGDAARLLSAGDLFLAPFIDGVSTRRGSLMAAMQHGLAVVGTRGPATDGVLSGSGALELVSCGDRKAFARAAVALASDPESRAVFGAAAVALYQREFDWPVIAARMCELLARDRVGAGGAYHMGNAAAWQGGIEREGARNA